MDYARDVPHGPWAGPEHACDPGTMKPRPEGASGNHETRAGGLPIIASALGHLSTCSPGGRQLAPETVGSCVNPEQMTRSLPGDSLMEHWQLNSRSQIAMHMFDTRS